MSAVVMILLVGLCLPGGPPARQGLNIYLLKDPKINLKQARAKPLEKLELADRPWIASTDIVRYDASAHVIYLKKTVSLGDRKVSLRGTPFVVTVDGRRTYLGALWPMISSLVPEASTAMIHTYGWGYSRDVVRIAFTRITGPGRPAGKDPRGDRRIIEALKRDGQYHAGIDVRMEKVEVFDKGYYCGVRHTYTIRNLDTDALYVLDPDRMGGERFHRFNWGLLLYRLDGKDKEDKPRHFRPHIGGTTTRPAKLGKKLKAAWFRLLKPGQSHTWTVYLEPYDPIPARTYKCSFTFHSPPQSRHPEKLKGGRIWIGRRAAERQFRIRPVRTFPATKKAELTRPRGNASLSD